MAFAGSLGLVPQGQATNIGSQLLGSVGRLTSAVGTAIGAIEQRDRDDRDRHVPRLRAADLRPRHRLDAAAARTATGFYRIAEHLGFTLRRLLFGRLVGMVFEGVFTWSC